VLCQYRAHRAVNPKSFPKHRRSSPSGLKGPFLGLWVGEKRALVVQVLLWNDLGESDPVKVMTTVADVLSLDLWFRQLP